MRHYNLSALLQTATIGFFLFCLILPGAQLRFGLFEEERLHGVVEVAAPAPRPLFSWQSFTAERFQREFDLWFQANLGLRGYLIRTDNQLNLSLFSEMSSNYGSPLVVGAKSNLFEKLYLDDFNQGNRIAESKIELLASKLERAAQLLKVKGIPLLVMLSPSKATVYSEEIPARYIDTSADRSIRNYDQLVAALRKKNVTYFDGLDFVFRLKATSPYRVFPKSGTHWSQHTSCLVVEQLSVTLSKLLERALPAPQCNPPQFKPVPEPLDRDLADLSNIWNVSRFFTPLPYPPAEHSVAQSTERYRPRLIFIGGSFLWTIFQSFEQNDSYRERTMLYYFKRAFHYPSGEVKPVSAKHYNWRHQLEGIDAVVIEINEANIHQAGGGSIGDIIHDLSPPRAKRRSKRSTSAAPR